MTPALNGASTSALNLDDATRSYLDGVRKQFDLTDDRLLAITRQFVDDFALGLGEYNKPMAMM